MAMTQINLVVGDMDATIAFYRLVGIDVVDTGAWPEGSDNRHIEVEMPGGFTLEFDSISSARTWLDRPPGSGGGSAILGFDLPSRDAVDECFARLVAAGHPAMQEPYDAFFGSRYAVVADPDGHPVGLKSPRDDAFRSPPVSRS